MPLYAERHSRAVYATQFTGDYEQLVTWGTAHRVLIARFLGTTVPHFYHRRDNLWEPIKPLYFLCKRPGDEEAFTLSPQSFTNLYEEIPA